MLKSGRSLSHSAGGMVSVSLTFRVPEYGSPSLGVMVTGISALPALMALLKVILFHGFPMVRLPSASTVTGQRVVLSQ